MVVMLVIQMAVLLVIYSVGLMVAMLDTLLSVQKGLCLVD